MRAGFAIAGLRVIRADSADLNFFRQPLETRPRYRLVPRHVRLQANGGLLMRREFLERGETFYGSFKTTFNF